jgi:hypothetical protein
MDAVSSTPRRRGDVLLLAHCRSLDPDAPTAHDRLVQAIGPELAHKLVFALGVTSPRRERFAA